MEKTIYIFLISMLAFTVNAQTSSQKTASVEKSIYGIQTGFLGVWVHNESRLSNSIALRSEIGLDAGLFGSSIYDDLDPIDYAFAPVITLEPRWYYNLNKRVRKSRKIENNSGNFVGLKISYNPDWFLISNVDNVKVFNQIQIVPKWAIRRTIGKHFNYEAGIGLGYRYTFSFDGYYYHHDNIYYYAYRDRGSLVLDLHLRIGYTF